MYHGGNLSERIRTLPTPQERLDFVKSFVLDYSGVDCAEYLSKTLGLDCLILNTDRHFNNLGIIADRESGLCRPAPVFDNGDSLLSNYGKFSPEDTLEENMDKAYGQPFSSSLELQAKTAGLTLRIDYSSLETLLCAEPASRALAVLRKQLEKYESVFRM